MSFGLPLNRTNLPPFTVCFACLVLLTLSTSCIDSILPPRCRNDSQCPTFASRCNMRTNLCEQTKANCGTNRDCPLGQICDRTAESRCYDICQSDSDCTEGNVCDATKERCVCARDECLRRDNGGVFGCQRSVNLCLPYCQNDAECDTGEKCLGLPSQKHCFVPENINHECQNNNDCPGEKPLCDRVNVPHICTTTPNASCTTDSDCINNPTKRFCFNGSCVACLADGDCIIAGQTCQEGTCR